MLRVSFCGHGLNRSSRCSEQKSKLRTKSIRWLCPGCQNYLGTDCFCPMGISEATPASRQILQFLRNTDEELTFPQYNCASCLQLIITHLWGATWCKMYSRKWQTQEIGTMEMSPKNYRLCDWQAVFLICSSGIASEWNWRAFLLEERFVWLRCSAEWG